MSDITADGGGVPIYQPPKQSSHGQLRDSLIILILLFATLFGVTYFVQSSASSTQVKTKPLSQLPITPTEKQQYQVAIDKGLVDLPTANQQIADAKPSSDKYPIAIGTLIITFGVIGIYLAFVYTMSFKEYRQVIRERFGASRPAGSGLEVDS